VTARVGLFRKVSFSAEIHLGGEWSCRPVSAPANRFVCNSFAVRLVRRCNDHGGMTLLAITIKAHTGVRLAEIGFLVAAIGGVLLMLEGMTPLGRRAGLTFGGMALAIGFVLLIVATRWGHFH
jgi:hypothetical protein